MKTRLFQLVLVMLFALPANAQFEAFEELSTDSVYNWLYENVYTDYPQYTELAYYTLDRAMIEEDYSLVARLHMVFSTWYYYNYDERFLDTMIYHRLMQIEYDKQEDNMDLVGEGYMNLSIDYMNSNQLAKAQDGLLKAVEIFEALDDEVRLAEVHINFAKLYNDLKKPKEALYFAELSLPMVTKGRDYLRMVDVLFSGFTYAYIELKDYPKALESINHCIDICTNQEFDQREYVLTESYNLKAKILLAQEELSASAIYFNKAWELGKQLFDEERAEAYRYGIGNVLYLQGSHSEALPHLLAGAIASAGLIDFDPHYFKTVSECFEQLGRHKEALEYWIKFSDLEKQITDDKIANLESEALVKYETDIKDENLLEQAQVISNKNKVQGLMIGVGTLLLLLLSTLFYYYKKNKKTTNLLAVKNQQIEERNQQNELLLKEIHHRVKNNLQTISSLLNLQSESISDKQSYDAVLESKNRVGSMALIHQKLYQGENLAAIEMKDYFDTVGKAILDSFGEKAKNVTLKVDMNEVELDVDTAVPIGLITNELITNSIKHAFSDDQKGEIHITLIEDGSGLLKLKVADNGQSSNAEAPVKKNDGFGTLLVQLLTTQIGGQVEYHRESGTSTIIQFPIQEKSVA